jgi:hypothetical protein
VSPRRLIHTEAITDVLLSFDLLARHDDRIEIAEVTSMTDLPTPDEVIASAAKFLIEGGEDNAASVLLACSIESLEVEEQSYWRGTTGFGFAVWLRGPQAAYAVLADEAHPIHDAVREAIKAVLPPNTWLAHLGVRAELMPISADWREELTRMARGSTISNQAPIAEKFRLWETLRFRSLTEIRIAEALDRAGVLFFPLCRARLSAPNGRVIREPDFLVCKDGKWGILEVDGEPFHPPSRTVQDHERDRLFLSYGIRLVQHFDADDCYVTPDAVVKKFLTLLDRAYP